MLVLGILWTMVFIIILGQGGQSEAAVCKWHRQPPWIPCSRSVRGQAAQREVRQGAHTRSKRQSNKAGREHRGGSREQTGASARGWRSEWHLGSSQGLTGDTHAKKIGPYCIRLWSEMTLGYSGMSSCLNLVQKMTLLAECGKKCLRTDYLAGAALTFSPFITFSWFLQEFTPLGWKCSLGWQLQNYLPIKSPRLSRWHATCINSWGWPFQNGAL